MPYVTDESKTKCEKVINEFNLLNNVSEGELNYLITKIVNNFLMKKASPPGYTQLNSVIGVLESSKLEFYRRAVAAYEDEKKEQNGDVY